MRSKLTSVFIAACAGTAVVAITGTELTTVHRARGAETAAAVEHSEIVPGVLMPVMDPNRGKMLFASKGCVVCHSINGVGGTDAPRLDAATMPPQMNPFEFSAKMWRGAIPMIMMQEQELGYQIEFNGQELADIVAFVHNSKVQKTFTDADIPPEIKKLMDSDEEDESGGMGGMMGDDDGDKADTPQ